MQLPRQTSPQRHGVEAYIGLVGGRCSERVSSLQNIGSIMVTDKGSPGQ